ncbi:hypothetical protein A11A3_15077 [Alcanivorax hongdengensis A-11-3]|uniref:Uncharacterized protein n=2 Tax=Alcanivorax hongdengensis TaxID=519051 RepID=L0W895_9GAMM|nr:hypothetical protein A11A3_15077 [Alcanivorax hongdengensis A-11-3]
MRCRLPLTPADKCFTIRRYLGDDGEHHEKSMIAMAALALAGCANKGGYVQFHDGEPLPPAQKAIVQGHYGYRDGSMANEMTRIVAINGKTVPKQWFVAEGANKVSLKPGYYELKILYVHGVSLIDYYSYITIPVQLEKNCTYQIITTWSSLDSAMTYDLIGKPSSMPASSTCGQAIVEDKSDNDGISI